MHSTILPAPPPASRAVRLWAVQRGIVLALLLLAACLYPTEPAEPLADRMAMDIGDGLGPILIFIGGGLADIFFSLPLLVLLPVFINQPLALPNATQRRRQFYRTVGKLQLGTLAVGSLLFLPRERFEVDAFLGFGVGLSLAAGFYLSIALVSARQVYQYWLADEYYWPEPTT